MVLDRLARLAGCRDDSADHSLSGLFHERNSSHQLWYIHLAVITGDRPDDRRDGLARRNRANDIFDALRRGGLLTVCGHVAADRVQEHDQHGCTSMSKLETLGFRHVLDERLGATVSPHEGKWHFRRHGCQVDKLALGIRDERTEFPDDVLDADDVHIDHLQQRVRLVVNHREWCRHAGVQNEDVDHAARQEQHGFADVAERIPVGDIDLEPVDSTFALLGSQRIDESFGLGEFAVVRESDANDIGTSQCVLDGLLSSQSARRTGDDDLAASHVRQVEARIHAVGHPLRIQRDRRIAELAMCRSNR